jgi:hypothetical protein
MKLKKLSENEDLPIDRRPYDDGSYDEGDAEKVEDARDFDVPEPSELGEATPTNYPNRKEYTWKCGCYTTDYQTWADTSDGKVIQCARHRHICDKSITAIPKYLENLPNYCSCCRRYVCGCHLYNYPTDKDGVVTVNRFYSGRGHIIVEGVVYIPKVRVRHGDELKQVENRREALDRMVPILRVEHKLKKNCTNNHGQRCPHFL